jgi:hypothetical protein
MPSYRRGDVPADRRHDELPASTSQRKTLSLPGPAGSSSCARTAPRTGATRHCALSWPKGCPPPKPPPGPATPPPRCCQRSGTSAPGPGSSSPPASPAPRPRRARTPPGPGSWNCAPPGTPSTKSPRPPPGCDCHRPHEHGEQQAGEQEHHGSRQTAREGDSGEVKRERGRYQHRDPPAHGAAYARDDDRDRQDAHMIPLADARAVADSIPGAVLRVDRNRRAG